MHDGDGQIHDECLFQFVLKCTCSHLRFCIFVMFSAFRDEMQYIFLEKKHHLHFHLYGLTVLLVAVKDARNDIIYGNANEFSFVSSYRNDLHDVRSDIFNGKKTNMTKFFSKKIFCISSRNVLIPNLMTACAEATLLFYLRG